jgi:hypothetical protein
MQDSPGANVSVYLGSLVRCSNFYRQDCLAQRPGQSFKEPQSLTPVALGSFQSKTDSYGSTISALASSAKGRGLLAGIDKGNPTDR